MLVNWYKKKVENLKLKLNLNMNKISIKQFLSPTDKPFPELRSSDNLLGKMERESMEEGLIKIPRRNINGDDEKDPASSVTTLLVLSTFVAVSGSFSYGCAIGFSSPSEAGILEDLGLSTAQYSVFGSMLTLGSMLGAIVSGKLADLLGRRRTMWFLEIFFLIGWFAIIFAKGAWWLHLGRLSMGFATGIQTYVSPVYVAEITPKDIRGGFIAAIQLMVCGGVSLMFFIGNVIEWRSLALIGALPCLVQVLGLLFIPESPRWLAKIGREKELEVTLQRLRGENTDVSQEATEIRDSTETFHQLSTSTYVEMFERKYARSLVVGIGLMILIAFGGGLGIVFYASTIFKAAGCSVSLGTTAMAVIQIPFCFLGVLLMDKSGRRPLLMVSLVGAFFGSFLVGLAFLFQDLHQWKELTSTLVLIGMLVYISCYAMGLAGIPWIIMAEIFPLNIKGSAGSVASFIALFCSWIVTYTFNFLFQWSSAGVFFIFAIISVSTIFFSAKLVPETKGRTLEEIETSILI